MDPNEIRQRRPHPPDTVIVDLDCKLAGLASELRIRLANLGEERICAREIGLDGAGDYIEDLNLEFAEVYAAYTCAAVLQLIALHASLNGRRQG